MNDTSIDPCPMCGHAEISISLGKYKATAMCPICQYAIHCNQAVDIPMISMIWNNLLSVNVPDTVPPPRIMRAKCCGHCKHYNPETMLCYYTGSRGRDTLEYSLCHEFAVGVGVPSEYYIDQSTTDKTCSTCEYSTDHAGVPRCESSFKGKVNQGDCEYYKIIKPYIDMIQATDEVRKWGRKK